MRLKIEPRAENELVHWKRHHPGIYKKILSLIANAQYSPYSGIGKPEPLKHQLSGTWSRRINREHRLIYRVENETLVILSCRTHYD